MDGSGKLIFFVCSQTDTINIYDGSTFTIKYTLIGPIGGYHISDPSGFFDVDADNSKELLVQGTDTNTVNNKSTYLFIDIKTKSIKYRIEWNGQASAISDINSDSYPEVIIESTGFFFQIWGSAKLNVSPFSAPMMKQLAQSMNYPNPFHQQTRIEYYLPSKDHVILNIFDPAGSLVRTLVNDSREMGEYQVLWDGRNGKGIGVASGSYYYQFKIGQFTSSKRMIMLK